MKRLAIALAIVAAAAVRPGAVQGSHDTLLAPIALYPDQLLAQILLCSTNPGKVAALDEWLRSQTAKGTSLQDAATASGFDPSFVALALFPDVVGSMASQIAWTTQVGEAFTADRSGVFASIQRLRAQAQKVGNLKDSPQQNVESKTTSSGQEVIVIEPANPQVVYVPQYNSEVVYTQPSSTTVVIQEDDDDDGAAIAGAMIGFTAGVAMGAMWDNNYYYGPYGYRGGFYMYDDAWDDYYDHREDAREDWADHREDMMEERGDRAENLSEERTERRENAGEQRTERTETRNTPEAQAQRDQRRSEAQTKAGEARASGQTATASQARSSSARTTAESRGYSGGSTSAATASQRSGTRSDAFSGYSSGSSERSASSRGQRSRSSSGGSRGGGSRGGGGRRR